jgi:hypothetical protein
MRQPRLRTEAKMFEAVVVAPTTWVAFEYPKERHPSVGCTTDGSSATRQTSFSPSGTFATIFVEARNFKVPRGRHGRAVLRARTVSGSLLSTRHERRAGRSSAPRHTRVKRFQSAGAPDAATADIYVDAGDAGAGVALPWLRSRARVPTDRDQRDQADRAVGLLRVPDVRVVRVP